MNILLLTSEFAPAMGGIGTYAREIAAAASRLGARVTVLAPDYARQTNDDDRSLPFEVVRFRGGLHSMRDMPHKDHAGTPQRPRRSIRCGPCRRLAVLHSTRAFQMADAGAGLDDGAWHRDQRNADAAEAHGDTRCRCVRAAYGGRRQQPLYRDAVPRTVCRRPAQDQRDQSGRIEILVRRATETPGVRLAYRLPEDRLVIITVARITRRKGHHLTLAALSLPSGRSAQPHHVARDRPVRRSRLCQRIAT